MASISSSPQTVLEAPAQAQPPLNPKTPPFADVATAIDSAGSSAAQNSPDNNVLSTEAVLKGAQPRESPTKDSFDSSPSEQYDSMEENETSNDEDEAQAIFWEKAKKVSKHVVKCGKYLQEMVEQVAQRPEKIRKLVSTDNEDLKITEKKDFKELPITPTINLVNWTDFKSKYMTQTQEHLIDVLIGEVKTGPQQPEAGKQDVDEGGNGNSSQENLLGKTSPSPSAAMSHEAVPSQIRINSETLIQLFMDVSHEDWDYEPILMSRPFSFLAYYKLEIQKVLARLEAKWADVERAQKIQTSTSLNLSKNSPIATKKGPPIAVVSAGHSETHTEIKSTSEKNEASLESPKEATPINVESVKVTYEEKLKEKTKAELSPTELMDSVEALRKVRCLMKFIEIYLEPYWNFLDSAKCQKIQFVDLGHIFKCGIQVFAPLGAEDDAEDLNSPKKQQKKDSKYSPLSNSRERYQTVWKVYRTFGGTLYLDPQEPELKSTIAKPMPFRLICYYLDFDGEKLGPVRHDFKINFFQGEKDTSSLPIYPMKFARNAAKIEDQMRRRGQMFREFNTFQQRYYIGASLVHQPSGDLISNGNDEPMHPEYIESQVIVDFRGTLQTNPQWCPELQIGKHGMKHKAVVDMSDMKVWKDKERKILDHAVQEVYWGPEPLEKKATQDLKDREPFLRDDYDDDERPTALVDLSDDDLSLLPARVFAYSFRNRKFGMSSDDTYAVTFSAAILLPSILVMLNVNNLRPVTPRVEGFNSLILPSGHKRIVQALVRSHFDDKLSDQSIPEEDDESDLVRGKGERASIVISSILRLLYVGKGLIVLLHGAPGVGKTSTAGKQPK